MTNQPKSPNPANSKLKSHKKLWLMLAIAASIILPLIVLDIRYRIEFAEYDNEAERIAQYLPGGTVEGVIGQEQYPRYKDGNGLIERINCYILGFGKPCPIVSRGYLARIESGDETAIARATLDAAGYDIETTSLAGTWRDSCKVVEENICTLNGKKDGFTGTIIMIKNRQDSAGPIGITVRVEPNSLERLKTQVE